MVCASNSSSGFSTCELNFSPAMQETRAEMYTYGKTYRHTDIEACLIHLRSMQGSLRLAPVVIVEITEGIYLKERIPSSSVLFDIITAILLIILVVYNFHQRTPLLIATKKHHKDVEKYLIDHGADVNVKDGVSGVNGMQVAG